MQRGLCAGFCPICFQLCPLCACVRSRAILILRYLNHTMKYSMKHPLITLRGLVAAALALAAALPAGARLSGAYYGTNYTVPFAHAYRALDSLGVDHREAIDRDAYHLSKLGLNAFRLHLWDVELSDAQGNLLENEHLALLDYLIATMEKRGISVILTAQTNFGNGYPERNTDPNGAFSYDFEKCHVHDDPAAQAAQERYLDALVRHVNPHTDKSYAADPNILAIEINNEPCHSGTHDEITAYVNRMASAIRRAGWDKDVIYNVSHNLWRTSAFYRADIDGTTYQWYPTGLVKGSRRRGNFLPVLDSYDIPFDTVAGYAAQPKLIYEYDPADVLDTYLFPAAARTFRKEGFDWVTQFAYDPIDMARFNTEYQTHYLNTAYTPGKAVGMAIAAEVMRQTPIGTDYGKYPVDTVFGDFSVSARQNLAMLNSEKKYYHTNSTASAPKAPSKLVNIMGVGSSPIVATDGLGVYFLDRLDADTWRLEILPDVVITSDPFARPSLHRTVAEIIDSPVTLSLNLPSLKSGFSYSGTRGSGKADGTTISVMPGVYLIGNGKNFDKWPADKVYDSARALRVGEYTMPPVSKHIAPTVLHNAKKRVAPGAGLAIEATVLSSAPVDSVLIYPASVDFWREKNHLIKMTKTGKYTYKADIDASDKVMDKDRFAYNIVVYAGGGATTFPSGEAGTPLDWDFGAGRAGSRTNLYSTAIESADADVTLLDCRRDADNIEFSSIPEAWRSVGAYFNDAPLAGTPALTFYRNADAPALETMVVSKYVGDIMADRADTRATHAKVFFGKASGLDKIKVGFVTRDGFTYAAEVPVADHGTATIDLGKLALEPTLLLPAPYPSFLSRRFVPDAATALPFNVADIESVTLYTGSAEPFSVDIEGVSLILPKEF